MGYQKILVDNVTCQRRFHVTFDPEDKTQAKVELKCPFCNITIFAAENHPPVVLARQENLIQSLSLSDNIIRECEFSDDYSKGGVGKLYTKDHP